MIAQRSYIIPFIVLVLLFTTACSSLHVSLSDEKSSFTGVQKFHIVEEERDEEWVTASQSSIETDIENLLRYKFIDHGLVESSREEAQVLIEVDLIIKMQSQTRTTNFSQAPYYNGRRNYYWEAQEIPIGTYHDLNLEILFTNQAGKKLKKARIAGVIDNDQLKARQEMGRAVDKMLNSLGL